MPFGNSDYYDFNTTNWNSVAGVYGIVNSSKQMIYVGETDDLKRRMDEHRADKNHCMHMYSPALVQVEVITAGETARRSRERALIAEYDPPCNRS